MSTLTHKILYQLHCFLYIIGYYTMGHRSAVPYNSPANQCLCGFAGFLTQEKYYKNVKKAEMTLFMDG